MTIDTSLYNLNKNAFDILTEGYARMAEVASTAIDYAESRRRPLLLDRLVLIGLCYDQIMACVVMNDDDTAIVRVVGEDVSVVNKLLVDLRTLTDRPL